MTINKKQIKITKLFRKRASAAPVVKPVSEDHEELQEEVQLLQAKLKEKQLELFQLQRNSYKHKVLMPKKKKEEVFVRPQKIILQNAVDSFRQHMELRAMLTGTEVQSYVSGEHCCVVFHMQHHAEHVVKHGLRIDMTQGKNEIVSSNLPLGFNLKAVMDDYDNAMKPECLAAIRKALFTYYDRLEQYQELKKYLNVEADLFKTLDGSHIQITLVVENEREEDDGQFDVVVMLDYRVYDIRPKNYSIKELDLPEGAAEILKEQCAVFKKKPLIRAFKEAFVNGIWPYKLVQQIAVRPEPQRRKRLRPNKHCNNDDTFRPEECSNSEDDVD